VNRGTCVWTNCPELLRGAERPELEPAGYWLTWPLRYHAIWIQTEKVMCWFSMMRSQRTYLRQQWWLWSDCRVPHRHGWQAEDDEEWYASPWDLCWHYQPAQAPTADQAQLIMHNTTDCTLFLKAPQNYPHLTFIHAVTSVLEDPLGQAPTADQAQLIMRERYGRVNTCSPGVSPLNKCHCVIKLWRLPDEEEIIFLYTDHPQNISLSQCLPSQKFHE